MLSSHLEKIALFLSPRIKEIEDFWSEEDIYIFKRLIFEKYKDRVIFLFENGKPKIFVVENDLESEDFSEILDYFFKKCKNLTERERFIFLLFISKLKFLKFRQVEFKEYANDILQLFEDNILKELSSYIVKIEHYFERKESISESLVAKLDKKFLHLLRVFHTFYVDINFEKLCINEKDLLEKYLRGFTLPEKYRVKLRKEWERINRSWKEDEDYLKNIELQGKKIIEDLRESINIEIGDFSKEIKSLVYRDKINLLLPYIKDKTAKWLRSFGMLVRDYNSLEKMKRDYAVRSKKDIFKNEFNPFLPSPDILIREWEESKGVFLKENSKERRVLEQIFFEYYIQRKKEKKDFDFLENFVKKGFISHQMDIDAFENEISYFMEEKFIPHVIGWALLNQVYILPDEMGKGMEKSLSYWITFKKLPRGEYYLASSMENLKIEVPLEAEEKEFISRFKEIVCILVYDIRGSTFMSLRLKNPVKELNIKNEFNKEMLSIVKKYGGLPLKDLGDGGVVLFAGNSKQIFEEVFEEAFLPKGKHLRIPKLFEKEVKIMPSDDSATRAVLCARDMYRKSLEFIRERYSEYRDWFPDVVESYPPLKALFRLGIGIGGGKPGKHIYMDYNSFGDIDATGSIINIANLLAQGKNPLTSLIYIDSTTFLSFLMNSKEWDVECKEEGVFERVKFYMDNINEFWVFDFPINEIKIKIVGTDLLDQPEKEKGLIFQIPEEVEFGEDDELIVKNHPVKLVYQVEPYERKI